MGGIRGSRPSAQWWLDPVSQRGPWDAFENTTGDTPSVIPFKRIAALCASLSSDAPNPMVKETSVSDKQRPKSHRTKRKRTTAKQRQRFLEKVHLNAVGIDIGAEAHWVAVPEDRDSQPVRKFSSFTRDLHALADWLWACGIETVAMESTGVYWIPLYELLEERGFEVRLVNARHVRNVPGRKTDVLDCQWIQQLHTFGLLRRSFRQKAEIAKLRCYLRHRDTLIEGAASFIQRMQKVLVLMNVQLHNVISDITGLTGLRILRAIVAGEHDPERLAAHRDTRIHASQQEIADSLRGHYRDEHVFQLRQALECYDFYQKQIAACDHEIRPGSGAWRLSASAPRRHGRLRAPERRPRRTSRPSTSVLHSWRSAAAWTRFLSLGRVFTANMTGNVVLLGFATAGVPGVSVGRSLTALFAFLLGAAVGGRFLAGSNFEALLGRVLATFGIEGMCLAAETAVAIGYDTVSAEKLPLYTMILLTSVAMGMQNAAVRRLAVPDLTTTVLTLTITGLAADSSLAGGSNPRWQRRTASVFALFAGAAIGAMLVERSLVSALLVTTIASFLCSAVLLLTFQEEAKA